MRHLLGWLVVVRKYLENRFPILVFIYFIRSWLNIQCTMSKQSNHTSKTESLSCVGWEQYWSHFWEEKQLEYSIGDVHSSVLFFVLSFDWKMTRTPDSPDKSDGAAANSVTSAALWLTITFHVSRSSLPAVFKGTLYRVLLFQSILSQ